MCCWSRQLICAVGPDSSFVLSVQTAQLCCWFRQLICAVGPGAHPQTLAVIDHLKGLLKSVGKLEEAEPLYREALAACRAASAPGDPSVVKAVVNLGMLLKSRGNLDEAEVLYREALETRRSTLGNLHPDTIVSINNLAMLLKNAGATVLSAAVSSAAVLSALDAVYAAKAFCVHTLCCFALLLLPSRQVSVAFRIGFSSLYYSPTFCPLQFLLLSCLYPFSYSDPADFIPCFCCRVSVTCALSLPYARLLSHICSVASSRTHILTYSHTHARQDHCRRPRSCAMRR